MSSDAADLIRAIAALLWPVLLLVLVVLNWNGARTFLQRLRKAKFFGQELELDASLDRLNETAEKVAAAEPDAPVPLDAGHGVPDSSLRDDYTSEEGKILEEVGRSPRLGLMLLSAELERAARRAVAALGLTDDQRLRRPTTLSGTDDLGADRDPRGVPGASVELNTQAHVHFGRSALPGAGHRSCRS